MQQKKKWGGKKERGLNTEREEDAEMGRGGRIKTDRDGERMCEEVCVSV